MTPDDVAAQELLERLSAACAGHPNAKIPWPHRLLHDAVALIQSLRTENTKAREYLSTLLTHYHPKCEPLPDLMGVCTQIDNMTTEIRSLRTENERQRSEVASLRLTLGGQTFSADVPDPIGCPIPGMCAQVAEIGRLRAEIERLDAGLADMTAERDILDKVFHETAAELGCNTDNEAVLFAIAHLRGAEAAMREKAAIRADEVMQWAINGAAVAKAIRALPLTGDVP